jgi:hypothetical protein
MQAAGIDDLVVLVEQRQIDANEVVVQPGRRDIATIQVEDEDSSAEEDHTSVE